MNLRLVAGTASRLSGTARRAWGAGVLLALVSALLLSLPSGSSAATAGWAGETILSSPATGNGWEPAIAADPSAPYVYSAWMQYKGNKVTISFRVSSDGGATWGPSRTLCTTCNGNGQYDVVLSTSSSGTVYATFMMGYNIMFTKSTDHGATWSPALQISGGVWADKPWNAVSSNGNDVYVTWATHGNVYAVDSHDGGSTWTTPLQVTQESAIYYYPNGGAVLPNGTAVMVASEYPESGNNTKKNGPIPIVEFRTTNGGTSWTRTVVDTLNTGATFATSSVTTVAADANGTLVLVYSGSLAVGTNGHVYVRRSTDSGATWSARTEMTTAAGGADATSVAAAGKGTGLFTLTWMDKRTGAWNVWQRGSTDGGQTWSADAKVSDATSGATYKTVSGFGFPYGDYDAVAINSANKTVAVMGEGDTSQINGDIWVNHQI
jgi:hypothetical protein